jgi:hypothetical protein
MALDTYNYDSRHTDLGSNDDAGKVEMSASGFHGGHFSGNYPMPLITLLFPKHPRGLAQD